MTQQNVMHCDANRLSLDRMRYDKEKRGMDLVLTLCAVLVLVLLMVLNSRWVHICVHISSSHHLCILYRVLNTGREKE